MFFQLFESGLWDEAERHTSQALHCGEPDPEALYVQGLLELRRGNRQQGELWIRKAEEQFPQLATLFDHRTALLEQQGQATRIAVYAARYREWLKFRRVSGFVVSYPKSGRTWLRFLLGRALSPNSDDKLLETDLLTQRLSQPVVHFTNDDYPAWKSIERMDRDKRRFDSKRVMLLVRDPRDVVVSYYFQFTKRGDREAANEPFSGTLSDFLRHPVGGFRSIVKFLNIWAESADLPSKFCILRYEDLRADPHSHLTHTLAFFGLTAENQNVEKAVAAGQFEKMRQLEADNHLESFRLRPGSQADPESFKTRRGVIGGYRDYLGKADIEWMDEQLKELEPRFGYCPKRELTTLGKRRA